MTPEDFARGMAIYRARRAASTAYAIGVMLIVSVLVVATARLYWGVENWRHGDGFVTTHNVEAERELHRTVMVNGTDLDILSRDAAAVAERVAGR